jgi:hypothetical protein
VAVRGEETLSGLVGQYRGPLKLQTRGRSDIENELNSSPLDAGMMLEAKAERDRYRRLDPARIRHRAAGPTMSYNCHGLTFAARRTQIWNSAEVQKILNEDGYQEVQFADVSVGDIAIYRQDASLGGEIDHSGIVVERGPPIHGLATEPWVLSKWGKGYEEIHLASFCPQGMGYKIEYYRIVR